VAENVPAQSAGLSENSAAVGALEMCGRLGLEIERGVSTFVPTQATEPRELHPTPATRVFQRQGSGRTTALWCWIPCGSFADDLHAISAAEPFQVADVTRCWAGVGGPATVRSAAQSNTAAGA